MYAGDRDRERAVAVLREGYADGRLTLQELDRRTDRVLAARSRWEIRLALLGLPVVRHSARLAARAALLVLWGTYLFFTMLLALAVGIALLFGELSSGSLAIVVLVWLVPAVGLWRLWRRSRPRPRPVARS